jgi:hypothetical protein
MPSQEEELKVQLHHAAVENARLRGELEAMRQSPSWRITRPLRAAKRLIKRPARASS